MNILYLCKNFNIMLSTLLLPVSNSQIGVDERKFFNQSYSNPDAFPDLSNTTIGFIGNGSDICKNARKSIENFRNHFKNIHIVDLGNVLDDSEDNLESIIAEMGKHNIIPVILGFDDAAAYDCYTKSKKGIHFLSNDLPFIEQEDHNQKNYIAYQRHIVSIDNINEVDENSFNSLSLGKLRSNLNNVEPHLRDIQTLYLNLNVMRYADAPNILDALPAGLTVEELCQIMKFVGASNNIGCVFINGKIKINDTNVEANLVALAIWYFLEGINMKINDHPTTSTDFSGYIINDSVSQDIEFMRHNSTQKWWLKLTDDNGEIHYLPCSNDEYTQTVADEIPDRILKFLTHH